MKTVTCKQVGGACDEKFSAETFEEIAEMSKLHAMQMFQTGDAPHLEAMSAMQGLMSDPAAMQEWMDTKRKEFDALPED
ncbi:MAG: DUF1059 domain-containing protein [SAR324 cluster bacterium]|nr:DUF1059 domain-containing protein [SAR324 cluster bacterium]